VISIPRLVHVSGTDTKNLASSQTTTHTGLQVNEHIVQDVGILDTFEQIGRVVHLLCLDDSVCGAVDSELAVADESRRWYVPPSRELH
jgi:hypothetical protein